MEYVLQTRNFISSFSIVLGVNTTPIDPAVSFVADYGDECRGSHARTHAHTYI
jgi:hypothetical protein